MAEEVNVPPEVLEVFLKIKQLVDATVEDLQGLQLSASGTATMTGSVSAVARPETVRAQAHIPTPTVTVINAPEALRPELPTVPQVKMARAWIEGAKAGKGVLEFLDTLEGLMQFIERLLGIRL